MPAKLDQRKVFYAILELIVKHRPSSITYSMVARKAGVPRSTLYYYFGKNIQPLIAQSIREGMKIFTRFFDFDKKSKYRSWDDFQKQRLFKVFKLVKRYPWIPALYFRYRNTNEKWGEEIREAEKDFSEGIAREWKRHSGKGPSWEAIRMSSYVKLGILWGFASDQKDWNKRSDKEIKKWLELSSGWVSEALGE